MKYTFSVPGPPQGKARPRFARAGNFVRTYTPDSTVQYEQRVQCAFAQSVHHVRKLSGPIGVHIDALFPVPKSASKTQRAAMLSGSTLPSKKPDADNIAKIILDALNGLAFNDDAQICDLSIHKAYADPPSVNVSIFEIFQ